MYVRALGLNWMAFFIRHRLYNLHMNTALATPCFNELPDLHKFILGLVADYHAAGISSKGAT